jgi:hypothetical protein
MVPNCMCFWFALVWLELTSGSWDEKMYNKYGVEEMYHICMTTRVERLETETLQVLYNWEGCRQKRIFRVRDP